MANGLTAQQLAAIKAGLAPQYSATGGGEAGSSTYIPSQYTLDGQNYLSNGQGGYWGFQDNPQYDTGSTTAGYNGTPYTSFDAQGNPIGDGRLSGIQNDSFMRSWGPFLATAALMAPAVVPGLGAAMSFGTNPVLGAGAVDAGGALAGGAGSMAGDLVDPSLGGAGGVGGAAGGAGGSGGALGTLGGVPQVSIPAASTFPEISGGSSWLSSLLPAGASSWLGPAAMALGALSGAKGTKTSETSTRKTDPRVDPYLFGGGGNPGLLGLTYQQLAQDQSPQSQANLQQMKGVAMGLLNQPVAGNGFNLLTKGRY
jgi:hypothetical protein